MGKTKGFLYAIQHREILMTDLGLIFISRNLCNTYFKKYDVQSNNNPQ